MKTPWHRERRAAAFAAAFAMVALVQACKKTTPPSTQLRAEDPRAQERLVAAPPRVIAGLPTNHGVDGERFFVLDFGHGSGAQRLEVRRAWVGKAASHFGPGWADANEIRLTFIDTDSALIWRCGNGSRLVRRTGNDKFGSADGETLEVTAGGWDFRMRNGAALSFAKDGRLTSEKNAGGGTRTFDYGDGGRLKSVTPGIF